VRTGADDLDGVADVVKTVLGGDLGGPQLNLVVTHLDRRPAAPTHQMVVMLSEHRRYIDSPVSLRSVSTMPAAAIDCSVR
jgi:hypothetical protein